MIEIVPFTQSEREIWNALNAEARNGHFLFDRRFMEYHSDRFQDCSYIFMDEGKPIGLLPANIAGDTLYSHQGLTFGGLVVDQRVTSVRMLAIWDILLHRLREQGVRRLIYKALPSIYHRAPAQEDLYALFRHRAQLIRRDVTTTIDYLSPGVRSKRRERGVKKAVKAQLHFTESQDWPAFWRILSDTLQSRHGVAPTHTLQEIILLSERLPEAIKLYLAEQDSQAVAGVVMFDTATVAHAQYIAASEQGRDVAALDGLFDFLIERYRHSHRFFDFGISNEDGGRILNEGLVTQKEEFGGSSVAHDVYEVVVDTSAL
ncbi:GNAT family N-acetyltransferase [Rhizobium freirei]|nr:GNAT family N-acetyltransferase [Rhizobium freirei]